MADKPERTNPGIELPPDEPRGDEPTGPIEGASAGAKHFRKAATIAAATRDDVATALDTSPDASMGERTTPTPASGRITKDHPAITDENLTTAADHARKTQEILERGQRGEAVDLTGQFAISLIDSTALEQSARTAKKNPRAKKGGLLERVTAIFSNEKDPEDDSGK